MNALRCGQYRQGTNLGCRIHHGVLEHITGLQFQRRAIGSSTIVQLYQSERTRSKATDPVDFHTAIIKILGRAVLANGQFGNAAGVVAAPLPDQDQRNFRWTRG